MGFFDSATDALQQNPIGPAFERARNYKMLRAQQDFQQGLQEKEAQLRTREADLQNKIQTQAYDEQQKKIARTEELLSLAEQIGKIKIKPKNPKGLYTTPSPEELNLPMLEAKYRSLTESPVDPRPEPITPYQQADLDIKREGLHNEGIRLAQQGDKSTDFQFSFAKYAELAGNPKRTKEQDEALNIIKERLRANNYADSDVNQAITMVKAKYPKDFSGNLKLPEGVDFNSAVLEAMGLIQDARLKAKNQSGSTTMPSNYKPFQNIPTNPFDPRNYGATRPGGGTGYSDLFD